jgi:hypothetical protein
MRRLASWFGGIVLVATMAAPAAAAAPTIEDVAFTSDPYVLAECDGYDVIEQDQIQFRVMTFIDGDGNWKRTVTHGSDTGLAWRSDTGEEIATYRDAGGTFTASADGLFTFTGIHNLWITSSGAVVKDRGRVVVAEVAPGDFERIFEAGKIPDAEPCSW